jgi:hypothetical protein
MASASFGSFLLDFTQGFTNCGLISLTVWPSLINDSLPFHVAEVAQALPDGPQIAPTPVSLGRTGHEHADVEHLPGRRGVGAERRHAFRLFLGETEQQGLPSAPPQRKFSHACAAPQQPQLLA